MPKLVESSRLRARQHLGHVSTLAIGLICFCSSASLLAQSLPPQSLPPQFYPVETVQDLSLILPAEEIAFDEGASDPNTPLNQPIPPVLAGTAPIGQDSNNLASPEVVRWLSAMIRENLPESYEDAKKWNQQKEVWDGVDVSRDGWKIHTKRKHKLVNHGTWTRYELKMVDPDTHLDIRFNKLEIGAGSQVVFDVSIEMLLDVFGRLSQWVRDVQLISISANADAVVRMNVQGTVDFQMNPLKFPPDIRIKPHVENATVEIAYFRVRRISQIGGPLAKHLGNGLRGVLENKLEESNQKLPDKMNRQIDKYSDRMYFSAQDWLQSKLPLPSKS